MIYLILIIFLFIGLLILADLISTKKEVVEVRKNLQEIKEILKTKL